MRSKAASLVAFAAALMLLPTPVAWAHEGEEELPARTLVEQAIVLLRNQPDQMEAIEDKIHDALEAEDAEGVDLELIQAADGLLEDGQLHAAQDLLEVSIGAAPHQVVEVPNPGPGLPAAGTTEAVGVPVLHERALESSEEDVEGGPILLGLAVAFGLAGLVLVRRFR